MGAAATLTRVAPPTGDRLKPFIADSAGMLSYETSNTLIQEDKHMRRRRVVGRGPSLVGAAATTAVVVGTAKVVGGAMDNAADQKAVAQQQAAVQQQQVADLEAQQAELAAQQQALAQQQAAAAAPAAGSLDEQLVQIQKLSVLKDQGLLTEEEFQAKKRQILGI
jgi:hypothetical protein